MTPIRRYVKKVSVRLSIGSLRVGQHKVDYPTGIQNYVEQFDLRQGRTDRFLLLHNTNEMRLECLTALYFERPLMNQILLISRSFYTQLRLRIQLN